MSAFGEYVTSTAFHLRLSKWEIRQLELLSNRCTARGASAVQYSDEKPWDLLRKGLCYQEGDGLFGPTPEGKLVAQLCAHAGLLRIEGAPARARAA